MVVVIANLVRDSIYPQEEVPHFGMAATEAWFGDQTF